MKQILQTHLGKALLCLLMVVLGGSNAWAETVTFDFPTLASDNKWANGTAYTSVVINPITITAQGGGNNGKYYTSDTTWRMYSGGTVEISAEYGYSISAVTSSPSQTFTISNGIATFKPGGTIKFKSITVTYSSVAPTTVATPTFSVAAGEVEAGTSVEISCATDGATIHYTTDGSTPTASSATYSSAITIDAATTIKAIAVKDGLDNSAVATATYTILEVVHGYSIDFEELPSKYVDWEFDRITQKSTNSNISSAHSGSNYGSTGGVTTGYIQTKNKVATPGTLTFYISKESTNTSASFWRVQTSSNKEDWTNVSSANAGSGVTKGEWTKVSADLSSYIDVYVRIYFDGTTAVRAIDDIELEVSSVAKPTFSVAEGTYFEAQNVKVNNYDGDYMYFYTTDGTAPACDSNWDPTGTSIDYDNATGIDITATTTLKMIAVDIDGNKSAVASATYTFPTVYTSIADFKAAETTGYLNLTGAQVVYIDGDKKNVYVRDASGAIDLFNGGGFSTTLQSGDLLSGIIKGTYTLYKQMPEITSIEDISVLTVTGNETVVAKVIDGTTTAIEDNLCDLVKIENTEITGSDPYYVGDNSDIQLYDKWKVGYTVTTDKAVDVSGVAINFDGTYEIYPRFESDIVYLDNAVEVSISAAGYATFCSDKALNFTGTDAIEVYYGTLAGDKLTFSRIYKVPANTGVLLVSALGGAVAATNVPVFDGVAADDVTDNCLTGVTEATTLTANDYILNVVNGGAGFYKAGSYTTLGAHKAYIPAAVGNGVKSFGINLTTGIALPATETAEKVIFDLSGRRVEKPAKGLYIVNGKKVLF